MASAGIDRHRHGNGGNDYGQGRTRCLRTNVITNIHFGMWHFGMWQNRKVHHDTQSDRHAWRFVQVPTHQHQIQPSSTQQKNMRQWQAIKGLARWRLWTSFWRAQLKIGRRTSARQLGSPPANWGDSNYSIHTRTRTRAHTHTSSHTLTHTRAHSHSHSHSRSHTHAVTHTSTQTQYV